MKKRFNAVYKTHNIRVMAENESQALVKLLDNGHKEPLQLIRVCGIDSHNYQANVE